MATNPITTDELIEARMDETGLTREQLLLVVAKSALVRHIATGPDKARSVAIRCADGPLTRVKMLNAGAKILDQEDQVQRVRRRAFKAELRVPLPGTLVDRVNEQGTYSDQLAGLQDTCHRVQQQRAPEMPALMANVDGQASKQDDGYRLVGRQSPHEPRRRVAGHHGAGCERVVAGDVWICLGRDEHARATAAMALKGMLAQPVIERLDSTPEILAAVPRLQGDGSVEAHELVVEHAVRRQQAGELGDWSGGPIQDLNELIPGGLVETKHPAVGERVLSDHPGRLDDEVG